MASKELAGFLHDRGFEVNSRKFKLFTFSKIYGKYDINSEEKTISFSGVFSFIVSSPLEEFCRSVVNSLIDKSYVNLGGYEVPIIGIEDVSQQVISNSIIIKTLSPVVAYSTMLKPNGKKYTCYFQPGEPEYEKLIAENLLKKYKLIYDKTLSRDEIEIKAAGQQKLVVINYKGTVIKGYSGKLKLSAPELVLQTAIDAGLGSKNSQGFGCVRICE